MAWQDPRQPRVIPEDEVVEERTYHNRFPGSTFIDPLGTVYSFDYNGALTTTSKNLQYELNQIADKPGCPVYTKAYVPSMNENTPVSEIQARAAETIAQLVAAQKG